MICSSLSLKALQENRVEEHMANEMEHLGCRDIKGSGLTCWQFVGTQWENESYDAIRDRIGAAVGIRSSIESLSSSLL